jgi:hypothetical protein
MADWLDELERKKKEENDRLTASVNEHLQSITAAKEARDRMYESVKDRVEPIFARLEALVERANKNDFYLIARRGEYEHKLEIFRYDAEETLVDVRRGELQINKHMVRSRGYDQHLKGVAEITLYPELEGLKIWFTEAHINMGWKKGTGKWYSDWEIPGRAKLHECVGTVPYDNITEDKMLELVKWIATGNEPIPRFRNVIPYKGWEPPDHTTRGCLYSPWTYIIPLGIILLYLYLSSQK